MADVFSVDSPSGDGEETFMFPDVSYYLLIYSNKPFDPAVWAKI